MTHPLTYKCDVCGKVYLKGQTDEEARAEYEQNFPQTQGDEKAVVCDDCYQRLMAWWRDRGREWYERRGSTGKEGEPTDT